MKGFVLIPLLLPPLLNLCAAASRAAGPTDEATARGAPIVKEDFERCTPRDKVLFDESRPGFWNLRYNTWGDNHLLHGCPEAPDITYDPALKGVYDIEVESRATDRPGGFGLKLASDSEFTILDVPNQGATATKHFVVQGPPAAPGGVSGTPRLPRMHELWHGIFVDAPRGFS